MKRILHLVALLAVALHAAQPLLGCTACVQQGEACAPACCTSMSDMGAMAGMEMATYCMTSMASIPGDPSCGLTVESTAFLPRASESLPLHTLNGLRADALFVQADRTSVASRFAHSARWSSSPISVSTSRCTLFQVFRI